MLKYEEVLLNNKTVSFKEDIELDVAGLFYYSELIIDLIKSVKNRIGYILPIKTIYGCPSVKWNGGRIIINKKNINYHDKYEEKIKILNEFNISPIITFTNNKLNEKDFYDIECNNLLSILNKINIPFKVRIVDDNLRKYIKHIYPNIKICASVIKVEIEGGKGDISYYKHLESKFDRYVVHPDDNFNYELLTQLDKSKAEILLNEKCYVNCNRRSEHYNIISNIQLGINANQDEILKKCPAIPEKKQINSTKRNISLSMNEFNELYNIGFRKFKLQGRTDNLYVFVYDILRYSIQDEYLIYQIYTAFCNIIKQYK